VTRNVVVVVDDDDDNDNNNNSYYYYYYYPYISLSLDYRNKKCIKELGWETSTETRELRLLWAVLHLSRLVTGLSQRRPGSLLVYSI
jgi:hypothetical protein